MAYGGHLIRGPPHQAIPQQRAKDERYAGKPVLVHRSTECPPHAANSRKIGTGHCFKPNFGVVWSYVNVATDS